MAEYWEIIALLVGLVLIIVEVFVIPGFGVTGIAGIALTLTSLVLIMLNNDFFNFEFVPLGDIVTAMFATLGGITGGILLLFFGGARLTKTKAFRNIALMDTQEKSEGYSVGSNISTLMGQKGVAQTVLRPSGKIFIGQQLYDASTRGEFINKGEEVEVIGVEGVTLRVKKVN
jgi:membrane-bound serine protease (ClpP class)